MKNIEKLTVLELVKVKVIGLTGDNKPARAKWEGSKKMHEQMKVICMKLL